MNEYTPTPLECLKHSAIESRTGRSESDIRMLFEKFDTAINMMNKINKRLERFWAKMLGIAVGAATVIGMIWKVMDRVSFKSIVGP